MKGSIRYAFVFVDVAPGKEESVVEKLLELDIITEAHLVTGPHDLLVLIQVKRGMLSDSTGDIVEFVRNKIRKIKGVLDTETIISQNVYTPKSGKMR